MDKGAALVTFEVGAGRLARRDNSLIFVSDAAPAQPFLRIFLHGTSSESPFDAIQNLIAERNFEAPALVLADWTESTLRVMLFGDMTISTNAKTAPRLSSADAGACIEHRIKRTGELVMETAEADPLSDTDLGLGIVPASGFKIRLKAVRDSKAELSPPAAEQVPPEQPAPLEPERKLEVPSDVVQQSQPAFLAAIGQMPPRDDSQTRVADLFGSSSNDSPSRPANPSEPIRMVSGQIEGKRCVFGHPNPPDADACARCGDDISMRVVESVDRPRLAGLRKSDGSIVWIDSNLSIGRQPAQQQGVAHVVLADEDSVSSHHAELLLDGWSLYLVDSGSTNGTFVALPNQDAIQIDPGVRCLVAPGATLFFGTVAVDVVEPDFGEER